MNLRIVARSTTRCERTTAPSALISAELTAGFLPAFQHQDTGEVRLCLLDDGRIAPLHVLDSLPSAWVACRDADGRPSALIGQINAGYLRGSEFWSLHDIRIPRHDA